MIHAKAMIVDDVWSVVGSTNFDHRSFELNDEVNLAVFEPALAARLTGGFSSRPCRRARRLLTTSGAGGRDIRLFDWLGSPD